MFNIARILEPAPGTGRGLFLSKSRLSPLREQSEEAIRSSSNDPKNLTRRANHRHMFNIARILEPAPGNCPRAFFIKIAPFAIAGAKRRSNPIVVERTERI
jgi:hypothetical protein